MSELMRLSYRWKLIWKKRNSSFLPDPEGFQSKSSVLEVLEVERKLGQIKNLGLLKFESNCLNFRLFELSKDSLWNCFSIVWLAFLDPFYTVKKSFSKLQFKNLKKQSIWSQSEHLPIEGISWDELRVFTRNEPHRQLETIKILERENWIQQFSIWK